VELKTSTTTDRNTTTLASLSIKPVLPFPLETVDLVQNRLVDDHDIGDDFVRSDLHDESLILPIRPTIINRFRNMTRRNLLHGGFTQTLVIRKAIFLTTPNAVVQMMAILTTEFPILPTTAPDITTLHVHKKLPTMWQLNFDYRGYLTPTYI
jgi:hypothetical protein